MLLLFRQNEMRSFARKPSCGAMHLTDKTRQLFATKKMIAETFTFKLPFASDSCG